MLSTFMSCLLYSCMRFTCMSKTASVMTSTLKFSAIQPARRFLFASFASDHCRWNDGSVANGPRVFSRRRSLTQPGPKTLVKMLDIAGFA